MEEIENISDRKVKADAEEMATSCSPGKPTHRASEDLLKETPGGLCGKGAGPEDEPAAPAEAG